MNILKSKKGLVIIMGIAVLLVISNFSKGNNKEQLTSKIEKYGDDTDIQHIEILDGNKSVAFIKKDDGTEGEIYFEKSLLSWKFKREFTFEPEGINTPIHLSFFQSPFNNEETLNTVLLRVFDNEISKVRIETGENIFHDFELLPKGSGERFGLFRTASEDFYEAEYIAYNSEGEVIYTSKSED
ncbi:hypothetical protein [Sporosarcina sp. FSL K6-1508]|uniref:hypothetical protein n=1 Tax=Sporosarcina sp. FSL K6-1508 TaxID=2921553 RepID=UPI0030FCFC4B